MRCEIVHCLCGCKSKLVGFDRHALHVLLLRVCIVAFSCYIFFDAFGVFSTSSQLKLCSPSSRRRKLALPCQNTVARDWPDGQASLFKVSVIALHVHSIFSKPTERCYSQLHASLYRTGEFRCAHTKLRAYKCTHVNLRSYLHLNS